MQRERRRRGHRGLADPRHSDQDLDFQRRALDLMRDAVEADQADPGYLEGRVAVNSSDPQIFGTQVGCTDEVDRRRAEVGLGPLDAYLAELEAGSAMASSGVDRIRGCNGSATWREHQA